MGISFSAIDVTRMQQVQLSTGAVEVPTRVELPEGCRLDLCYGNARLLFGLLSEAAGLELDPEYGSLELPLARRVLMAARSRFDRLARWYERAAGVEYGAPRSHSDGTITLRPVRVHVFGADREYLARRLDDLADFVHNAGVAGATHVTWA